MPHGRFQQDTSLDSGAASADTPWFERSCVTGWGSGCHGVLLLWAGQEFGVRTGSSSPRKPILPVPVGEDNWCHSQAREIGERNSKPTVVSQRASPEVTVISQDLKSCNRESRGRATSKSHLWGWAVCLLLTGRELDSIQGDKWPQMLLSGALHKPLKPTGIRTVCTDVREDRGPVHPQQTLDTGT